MLSPTAHALSTPATQTRVVLVGVGVKESPVGRTKESGAVPFHASGFGNGIDLVHLLYSLLTEVFKRPRSVVQESI